MLAARHKKDLSGRLAIALAALFILAVPFTAVAASLVDYKQRIEKAVASADELLEVVDDADTTFGRSTIAQIAKDVPVSEKIEWAGGSVETDNAWLASRLAEFTAESDVAQRKAILTEIGQRLLSIAHEVDALEKATQSPSVKDQDKQKLDEILSRQEYQKPRAAEESLFQKWSTEFLEWLARVFPRPSAASPSLSPGGGLSLRLVLQIIVFLVVISYLGYRLYRSAPYLLKRFGSREGGKKHDRVILGERIAADDSAADLFSEAERLAREGNVRAAIRKGYIAALCDLGDRQIVRLARHKTNRDYLRDVKKHEGLFENMTGLTRDFESNWYGLRSAEQADWEAFRDRYLQTIATATGGSL